MNLETNNMQEKERGRASHYLQVENKVRALVNYELAGSIPLVR
jgi:hypothetical protein